MATENPTNGTPPADNDWGERTIQSCRTYDAPGYWKPDAYEIRMCYGVPEFEPGAFDPDAPGNPDNIRLVYPDLICHEKKANALHSNRGTDALIKGDRDAGKTTYACNLSQRLMANQQGKVVGDTEITEDNRHVVVWRGSGERSGWLKLKKWATVYLPKNADADARWMNEDDTPAEDVDDLESQVRAVRRYDDVYDLLDQLEEEPAGSFTVVYPDPSFAGCEQVMEETNRVGGVPEYTPGETTITHWWFAFLTARTEYGPFRWMALVFDEANDMLPSDASNDDSDHAKKIELLRSIWASSRKRLLSMYWFVHHEEAIHPKVRREVKWRIDMPDDEPNPRMKKQSSLPVGMGKVPMRWDLMSDKNVGTGLCYTANKFTLFGWTDIPGFAEDQDRWLSISLTATPIEDEDADETEDVPTLEFDEAVFSEWENQTHHRLYVNDPGEGYIDVADPGVGDLISPIDDLEFVGEARETETHIEIRMTDGDEELVVARLPANSVDEPTGIRDQGVGA